MSNSRNNSFIIGAIIFVLCAHLIAPLFSLNAYVIDRFALITSFGYLLLNYNYLSFKKTGFIAILALLAGIYGIASSYFSIHINTQSEADFQRTISLYYTLYVIFIVLYGNTKLNRMSMLKLLVIINVAVEVPILVMTALQEISLQNAIINYFINIRYLNHIQTITILPILYFLGTIKNKKTLVVLLIVLFMNAILLVYTGARGTILSLAVASIVFWMLQKRDGKLLIVFFAMLCAAYMGMYFVDIYSKSGNMHHLHELHISGRAEIYPALIPYIAKLKYVFSPIGFMSTDIASYGFAHPHNLYLYMFLGLGTAGMLLVIGLHVALLLKLYKKQRNRYTAYLFASLLAISIHAMISGIYIAPMALAAATPLFLLISKMLQGRKGMVCLGTRIQVFVKAIVILIVVLVTYMSFESLKHIKLKDSGVVAPGYFLHNKSANSASR